MMERFARKSLVLVAAALYCHCASMQLSGEKHEVITSDDWKLTLEHFPSLLDPSKKKKYPVLVCHGFGADRNYYKASEENSFARSLQRAGYDVWLMDLRGRMEAGETGVLFGHHTYSYDMDAYVREDLESAITFVLQKTGAKQVNYVGHSLGGMIMHARLGTLKDGRVANFVAVAAPMSFVPLSHQIFTLYRARGLLRFIPVVPIHGGAVLASMLPAAFYHPFTRAFVNPDNIDDAIKKQLMRASLTNISKKEMRQFIMLPELGGMFSADGSVSYRENLKNIGVPIYLIAGRSDELADPATIRDVYERVGSKDKTFEIFSRSAGYSADYGHIDLIAGKVAYKEVHPRIIDWLNKRN